MPILSVFTCRRQYAWEDTGARRFELDSGLQGLHGPFDYHCILQRRDTSRGPNSAPPKGVGQRVCHGRQAQAQNSQREAASEAKDEAKYTSESSDADDPPLHPRQDLDVE